MKRAKSTIRILSAAGLQRAFCRAFPLDNSNLSKVKRGKRKLSTRQKKILESKDAQRWIYHRLSEKYGAVQTSELLKHRVDYIERYVEGYPRVIKKIADQWGTKVSFTRERLLEWSMREEVPIDYWRRLISRIASIAPPPKKRGKKKRRRK